MCSIQTDHSSEPSSSFGRPGRDDLGDPGPAGEQEEMTKSFIAHRRTRDDKSDVSSQESTDDRSDPESAELGRTWDDKSDVGPQENTDDRSDP